MVLLIAFLHVVPPMNIGEYRSRDECEQVRAELVASVGVATSLNVQFICFGPDMELERKRFKYGPRP
jgi:hypothetical protein